MLFSRVNLLFALTPSLIKSVLQLLLMKYSRSKVIRCLNVNFIRHFFLIAGKFGHKQICLRFFNQMNV